MTNIIDTTWSAGLHKLGCKKNVSVSCDEHSFGYVLYVALERLQFLSCKDFCFFFRFLVFRSFALCKHRKRWCYCKKKHQSWPDTLLLFNSLFCVCQVHWVYMPTPGVALWYELTIFSIEEKRARLRLLVGTEHTVAVDASGFEYSVGNILPCIHS